VSRLRPPSRTDVPALTLLLAVALGGAVGACLRAAVGHVAPTVQPDFPWTTFGINVGGSALLALLPALGVVRRRRLLAPLLGTGVLGGFTTLSAWSQETHDFLAAEEWLLATAYGGGTLAACLVVVALVDHATRAQRERDLGEDVVP
jgi:fluoride exporter